MNRAKTLRRSDPARLASTGPPQWCGAVGLAIGTLMSDLHYSHPIEAAAVMAQANEVLERLGCPLRITREDGA